MQAVGRGLAFCRGQMGLSGEAWAGEGGAGAEGKHSALRANGVWLRTFAVSVVQLGSQQQHSHAALSVVVRSLPRRSGR